MFFSLLLKYLLSLTQSTSWTSSLASWGEASVGIRAELGLCASILRINAASRATMAASRASSSAAKALSRSAIRALNAASLAARSASRFAASASRRCSEKN